MKIQKEFQNVLDGRKNNYTKQGAISLDYLVQARSKKLKTIKNVGDADGNYTKADGAATKNTGVASLSTVLLDAGIQRDADD